MTLKRRLLRAALAVCMLALSGTMIVAPPAGAAPGECPPGYGPVGPGTDPDFFDQNVSVFAGGNFSVGETAAESEGVLVALGNASFQKAAPGGSYNVGVVGQGSGVPPNAGTDMLIVGGDMSGNAQTTVDVGFPIGGNIVVGGTIVPGTVYTTNGGEVRQGVPDATAPYAGIPDLIESKSAEIAAMADTGQVAVTNFSMTFVGDGSSTEQVFTVGPLSPNSRSIQFLNIPPDAAVYVNLVGSSVDLNINNVSGSTDELVEAATHTIWNFPEASNVLLRGGSQFPGSILVPNRASNVANSMPGLNGRIYVNGNLQHLGQGTEMHSYPFLPDDELDCLALFGAFSVAKVIAPPGVEFDPTTVFSGTYTCLLNGQPAGNGTWSTTAGAGPTEVVTDIALGAVCTVEEDPPPDPPPNNAWQPAVISPASITIADDGTPVGFTVTNTLAAGGGFTVDKVVEDPDSVVDPTTAFSGTYSCTLDGADVTPTPNTWSTTAGADPVVVTSALPLGSVCTLTETPPAAPDGNHAWQPAVITPAQVTITTADTSVGFTVTNTLTELLGGFTIDKTVVDPDGLVDDATEFTGTWTCTLDGQPAGNGTWTVTDAAPAQVVTGIALGSQCTLTETPPASPDTNHEWDPVVFTPSNPFTVTDATTPVAVTVTNTLTELPGGFTIDKTVVDPDGLVDDATEFTGTWTCTLDGQPAGNGTWTVTDAAPAQVVTGIALGSQCTLTETPPASPDTNHEWDPVVFTPSNPFTVTDATTPVAVTVTNTLTELPGGFTIDKTVVDPDGLVDPSTVFGGTFTCTLGATDVTPIPDTWSTTAGAAPVVVTDEVPLGSVCTVSETPPVAPDGNHAWQPADIAPASVTITDANTSVGFTVTNTLVELPGGFTVAKTVVDPDAVIDPTTVYSGTYSCDLDGTDVTPVDNTWSTTAGAAPATVTDQLPLGSVCTLVETPPAAPDGNHAWQPAVIAPASVTITDANTSVGFTVTNTLVELPGGFTVAKTVVDPDSVVDPSTVFGGTFTCTLGATDVTPIPNTWSTTAGAAPIVVTDEVPLGSVCTISETPPLSPDTNHAWQPANIAPASVTITDANTSVGFTVTNTLVELPGGFTVAKVVVDPDAVVDPTTVYSGTYSCLLDGTDVTPVDNTWSTTAGAAPAIVTDQLPLGSVCTLVETPPASPDTNHEWQPAVINPTSVTITDANTTIGFTVTNTLGELPGGFTIDKVVVDPDAVVDPTTVYSGTYSCLLDGTDVTPVDNTWSTTAGAAPAIVTDQLPLGSICTLVETLPVAPDGNHAWQPAVINPTSVTITDANTSVGFTVTNTLVELPGGFTVTKTVVDPDSVVDPTTIYAGTFSCDLDGTDVTPVDNTWSTTAGAAPAIVTDQLPLGSICTLVETLPVAPDGNHAWEPANIAPASVTITDANTSVGFTVTNTLVELPGGFTVDKTVNDPDSVVDPDLTYSGTFSCTLGATDVTPIPNTWSTTAGAGPVVVTDEVPLGSVCTVSETPPTAPDGNHAWEPAVINPTSVTITDANTTIGFIVTNTLIELPGGFTIDKTVNDPDAIVDPTTLYSGTYSCLLDGTDVTPVDNTWSTTAGAAPAIVTDQLPLGSVCTLVETPPAAPDGNHAWQPANIAPANVTITDANTSVGFTVTNTLTELPGGFTVAKTVVDPDAVVDPTTIYSGTYTCDLDGTDVTPVPNTWSTTAGAAPATVTDQLPLGSVCTLVETEPTDPDADHAWQPAIITPASVTITDADTSVGFTVTNSLAELPGGFTVAKTVVDPDSVVDPTTIYSGTFSCTLGATDVTPTPNTWSTTAGAAPAIVTDQLPLGSVCTLVETPPASPDTNREWQPAVINPTSVTITDANTSVGFTVTNTLIELPGGFTIDKVVVDPDAVVDPTTVYSGTYSCDLDGTDVTPVDNTWSTTAGAAPAIVTDQLPLGSVCTLVETPPASPDTNHEWEPAIITPASVTITDANTSVGFTVTNTLTELPGGFTIDKTVNDPDAIVDPATVFAGTYTCTLGATDVTPTPNTWSTTAGADPVVVTDEVPLGSVCTVSETPPVAPDADHAWQPAIITPASVTITDANTSVGFTVTNTLVELPGGFTIAKTVNDPDAVVDPTTFYSGTYSCLLDGTDVTPVDNTWSTTAGAAPAIVTDQLPLGSVCTLVETLPVAPDGNHAWEPANITPASVTITDANTSVGFTVTNTLVELPGGFTIAKTVNDPDAVVDPTTIYSGTFSCTLGATDVTPIPNTWSTTAGDAPVLVTDEVPLGSVCTVSETPPVAPDGNHAWQPANIAPASVTITDANTSVGFTVTNTLVELPGGFTVDKTVNDPDAIVDPATVFAGTYTCDLDGTDVTPVDNTWSTTAGAAPAIVTDQLPLGSVCTLVETPSASPDTNHEWQPAVINPTSVTITDANTSVGFTVTNTLVELPGGFTIDKVVVDPDGVVDPATVFGGTFTCTLGATDVTPTPNTWSTTAGADPIVVTDELPLGSVCTVSETPPVAPDGNHAWEPANITPASVTITDANTSVGFTVTNTLVELPGGFTIDKTVNDPDTVVDPTTVYSGTFSCDLDGTDVTPTPNTWSTTAAAAPVVVTSAVPLGSVCTLVETQPTAPDGNHAWEPAQITPTSVTITDANTSVGFTVTNTLAELPGGFTIDKTVNDPDTVVDPTTVYSGTFSCDLDGTDVTPTPNTWTTTAGAPPAIVTDQVPLGSTCTLVETAPTSPDGNHAWRPAQVSPASVTITDADTSVGFTVTNTLVELPGGFTVAKLVVDPDAVVDPDLTYSGTFSCLLDGVDVTPTPNTWSTTAGAPPAIVTDQLPLGSVCTLSETPPADPDADHEWQPAAITPASVTVTDANTNVGFTVTNFLFDLPGEPNTGGFTIEKRVVDPDEVVDPDLTYSGTFSCLLSGVDVTPVPNTWSTTAGAPPVIVTQVPEGSVCTIVESPPAAPDANHAWQPAVITPASVTISTGDPNVAFTVTNTLVELTGGFTVTKTVAGDPDGLATGDTFTGTWSCVDRGDPAVTGVWSVTAGGPAQTVSGIALGSECTLTEDTPTPPDTNHEWEDPVFSPASVTITETNTGFAFTVTNTLTELTGGFTVAKVVAPVGAVPDSTVFSGTYSCVDGAAAPQTGTWSTSVAGPAFAVSGITLDSECTLVETPPAAPDANHVWQPAVFTPSNPFTVTDAATPVAITATNTLTELTGGFTVAKTVVDPDAVVPPGRVYAGTFSCDLDGTDVTPTPNTWTTTAGAPPAIVTDQVPLGSVCTLVETPPAAPDANHEWHPAQITPASVTITDAATSVGFTVTNTLTEVLSTGVDTSGPVTETQPQPTTTTTDPNNTTVDNNVEADLASTGPSTQVRWLAWIGLLAVIAGMALVWPFRRARRHER